ncbi:MAG: bifunctional DNA-formamidopyrimidine glycosylase/DNA-(apurinic or apyrimidinic site) lyase [Gammaproteobacteria bacterium]|nr:bifunctional DNA-formamidopyrimidine glycosylase/DNA-(apurinic or apyrimidinic site) lyase [Gammaproteobacteria bacterium]
MPELPEVETSRRGIQPHVINKPISDVIIRQKKLRWPIPARLKTELINQTFHSVERRGKYLLLQSGKGCLIIHLGMSGSLRITDTSRAPEKHDHFDILFNDKTILRLRDPRRFGAVLWTKKNPLQHKLLQGLGPEPLTEDFTAKYLAQKAKNRRISIKSFIMNSQVVVGVGNIYANEALFLAGINPKRQCNRISITRLQNLTQAIKEILSKAIQQGGTTLRDFTHEDGKPGYFQQTLNVYGKKDQPCPHCGTPLKHIQQQQRSTYYCCICQS